MTTPKDKTKQLTQKYEIAITHFGRDEQRRLKETIECAKIAVDEVLANINMYEGSLNPKWKFWVEVKQELEKM
jgi:hypothetical protein